MIASIPKDVSLSYTCLAELCHNGTGWSGGSATSGAQRISIQATREIITSILTGAIEEVECSEDPVFGTLVPRSLPGVDSAILRPRGTWADGQAYDETAGMLTGKFKENFSKYAAEGDELLLAGPRS